MKNLPFAVFAVLCLALSVFAQSVIVSRSTVLRLDPKSTAKVSSKVKKGQKLKLTWFRPVNGWYLVESDKPSDTVDDFIKNQFFGWIRASSIVIVKD